MGWDGMGAVPAGSRPGGEEMTDWDRGPGRYVAWAGGAPVGLGSPPPLQPAWPSHTSARWDLQVALSKRTSPEVGLAAQSIFPEPPQTTSEGHHFWQSRQTQIH